MEQQYNQSNFQKYFNLLADNPWLNASNDLLRILIDESEMLAWEEKNQAKLGIVLQDRWITVVRDLVEFTNGSQTGYNRIINTAALEKGAAGAVVLPVMDGKVLLIRIFRHRQEWD